MSKLAIPMNEGDTLLITEKHDHIFTKCCDCGLIHRIDIIRNNGKMSLKFYRIDDENSIDWESLDIEGTIPKENGDIIQLK